MKCWPWGWCARTLSFMIDHDDPDYIWQLVWPSRQTAKMPTSESEQLSTIYVLSQFDVHSVKRHCMERAQPSWACKENGMKHSTFSVFSWVICQMYINYFIDILHDVRLPSPFNQIKTEISFNCTERRTNVIAIHSGKLLVNVQR